MRARHLAFVSAIYMSAGLFIGLGINYRLSNFNAFGVAFITATWLPLGMCSASGFCERPPQWLADLVFDDKVPA